jgi:hypothetical protein
MSNRQVFLKSEGERREHMSEQDNKPKQQEEKKDGVRHNWVTDIYDKMNISVRSLDIALIVLCAIVVFCFIYGANH